LLNWSDNAALQVGAGMDLWFGSRDGKQRLRKLTAEADADRAAAQTGYQPLLSRLLKRLRRSLFGHHDQGGNGDE
jgi:hypothetical protein